MFIASVISFINQSCLRKTQIFFVFKDNHGVASMTLLLSQKNLTELLNMKDTISTVENVFKAHGEGKVVMPPKLTLDLGESGNWPGYNAFMNAMPAYIGTVDIAGLKWAGGFWENPKRGLSSIMAIIVLIDPKTGVPLVVMEGSYITALRTGAATAVGAKYLAKRNSSVVGMIGAGTQAEYNLEALNELFNIEEVRVSSRSKESALRYANKMHKKLGLNLKQMDTAREAVKGADIVVTATTSKQPILKQEWIQPGTFIAAIGSYQEVDDDVAKKADKIVVDNLEQVKHRGSLRIMFDKGILTADDTYAELGEIVAGKKRGRETDREVILLVPIGMGSEDVAVAYLAYKRAKEKKMGQEYAFF